MTRIGIIYIPAEKRFGGPYYQCLLADDRHFTAALRADQFLLREPVFHCLDRNILARPPEP